MGFKAGNELWKRRSRNSGGRPRKERRCPTCGNITPAPQSSDLKLDKNRRYLHGNNIASDVSPCSKRPEVSGNIKGFDNNYANSPTVELPEFSHAKNNGNQHAIDAANQCEINGGNQPGNQRETNMATTSESHEIACHKYMENTSGNHMKSFGLDDVGLQEQEQPARTRIAQWLKNLEF